MFGCGWIEPFSDWQSNAHSIVRCVIFIAESLIGIEGDLGQAKLVFSDLPVHHPLFEIWTWFAREGGTYMIGLQNNFRNTRMFSTCATALRSYNCLLWWLHLIWKYWHISVCGLLIKFSLTFLSFSYRGWSLWKTRFYCPSQVYFLTSASASYLQHPGLDITVRRGLVH